MKNMVICRSGMIVNLNDLTYAIPDGAGANKNLLVFGGDDHRISKSLVVSDEDYKNIVRALRSSGAHMPNLIVPGKTPLPAGTILGTAYDNLRPGDVVSFDPSNGEVRKLIPSTVDLSEHTHGSDSPRTVDHIPEHGAHPENFRGVSEYEE